MNENLTNDIQRIENDVILERYAMELTGIENWGGADVIIDSKMTDEDKRWIEDDGGKRLVITKYSKELNWLFCQLRDAFDEKIESITKYSFYGDLAQTAIDYIKETNDSDVKGLLLSVIGAARNYKIDYIEA